MPEANNRITPKLKRHQQKRTNLFIKIKEYQTYKINGARQKKLLLYQLIDLRRVPKIVVLLIPKKNLPKYIKMVFLV